MLTLVCTRVHRVTLYIQENIQRKDVLCLYKLGYEKDDCANLQISIVVVTLSS